MNDAAPLSPSDLLLCEALGHARLLAAPSAAAVPNNHNMHQPQNVQNDSPQYAVTIGALAEVGPTFLLEAVTAEARLFAMEPVGAPRGLFFSGLD